MKSLADAEFLRLVHCNQRLDYSNSAKKTKDILHAICTDSYLPCATFPNTERPTPRKKCGRNSLYCLYLVRISPVSQHESRHNRITAFKVNSGKYQRYAPFGKQPTCKLTKASNAGACRFHMVHHRFFIFPCHHVPLIRTISQTDVRFQV